MSSCRQVTPDLNYRSVSYLSAVLLINSSALSNGIHEVFDGPESLFSVGASTDSRVILLSIYFVSSTEPGSEPVGKCPALRQLVPGGFVTVRW